MDKRVYDNITTREAFGRSLLKMASKYSNLMYVAADTLTSMGGELMHKMYPERAINIGIAEQNMALMGTGMAACGAKTVIATYATFASMRICEQIRTFICYPKLDVKIVAGLGGMTGDQEGVTHQGIEDIGVLRSIPNLTIVEAADAVSASVITEAIIEYNGPVYLRLGRTASVSTFDHTYTFEIGKANVLCPAGNDAAVIATGFVVHRAKEAVAALAEEGFGVQLIEMPCIKPLDDKAVIKAAQQTRCIVTLEDHNVIGGLGSAVAEVLSDRLPTIVKRVGIDDMFTESGEYSELLDKYNLSVANIVREIKNAILCKRA